MQTRILYWSSLSPHEQFSTTLLSLFWIFLICLYYVYLLPHLILCIHTLHTRCYVSYTHCFAIHLKSCLYYVRRYRYICNVTWIANKSVSHWLYYRLNGLYKHFFLLVFNCVYNILKTNVRTTVYALNGG